MKILINTSSLKLMGGVASHYKGLRAFWTEIIPSENVMQQNVAVENIGYFGTV